MSPRSFIIWLAARPTELWLCRIGRPAFFGLFFLSMLLVAVRMLYLSLARSVVWTHSYKPVVYYIINYLYSVERGAKKNTLCYEILSMCKNFANQLIAQRMSIQGRIQTDANDASASLKEILFFEYIINTRNQGVYKIGR